MFSHEKIDFILQIHQNGGITKKTQKIFKGFGYYLMIWSLRDDGIVKENGLTKDKEKIWMLTERGIKLAKDLKKLKQLDKEIGEIVDG